MPDTHTMEKERKVWPAIKDTDDDNPFFLLVVDSGLDAVIGSITMDEDETYFRANFHPEGTDIHRDLGSHVDMYLAYHAITSHFNTTFLGSQE